MSRVENRFLILGLTGIVMRDLVGTIKDAFPTLVVDTADTVADAMTRMSQVSGWKYAFLNLDPDAFVASELSELLESVGTKIILLGDAAEDTAGACPYPVLARPFAAGDILRLLKTDT